MFNTFLYCLLLIIQLFVSDSAEIYNQKIGAINQLINKGDFKEASLKIQQLKKQTIFNNFELENTCFLLNLKTSKLTNKKYQVNKRIYHVLQLFNGGEKTEALNLLKYDLTKNPQDTTIMWYEILHHEVANNMRKMAKNNTIQKKSKVFDEKEAMDLLNLMKNKEKYIEYEL